MIFTTLCGGWLAGVTSMERPVGMRLPVGGEVSKGQPLWNATWVVRQGGSSRPAAVPQDQDHSWSGALKS